MRSGLFGYQNDSMLMRSVIDGGQVALPLAGGRNEIEELRKKNAQLQK
mgnify:CR=1 FL=1